MSNPEIPPSPRYLAMAAAQRRAHLAMDPHYRQEAVARHYASLAQTALTMSDLIKQRQREVAPLVANETLDPFIAYCEQQIAQAHFDAFGEWPTWWHPKHTCHESGTCTCSIVGLEPDEECPVHGAGEWPPRCCVCGRFIDRKREEPIP